MVTKIMHEFLSAFAAGMAALALASNVSRAFESFVLSENAGLALVNAVMLVLVIFGICICISLFVDNFVEFISNLFKNDK